jgi:hypothetical protein
VVWDHLPLQPFKTNKKEYYMQITVDQTEIEQAIKNFIGRSGIAIENKELSVTLTAGRGPAGITASVDMTDVDELPGNKPTDNFKLKSKTEAQTTQDTKEVNEILDKELADKPTPEKEPVPEPDEDEVPVTDEADDDIDSLFGS